MDAQTQLEGFIARFSDEVAATAREAVAKMRNRLPWATAQVYDNYNALAVSFGASPRMADTLCSIAVYPRWVSLFLIGGQKLDDPHGLLKGQGATMRHVVLTGAAMLDDPRVQALLDQALVLGSTPADPSRPGVLVIKSVSEKQRPRRPA